MEKQINKIGLFPNNNQKSQETYEILKKKLKDNNYIITNKDFDLAISIGGDGAFLRMIKKCTFSENIYYLGINTGTLGFATEIYPDNIDEFIERLKKGEYKIEKIGVEETKIYSKENKDHFYSLNEIVIRDKRLNTMHLEVYVDDNKLEDFSGDGLLVSTSFGSTAYNLSFGGSIVYNDLHTLQITAVAPLNSKCYHSLSNSVIIPEERKIKIIPQNESLIITIDGENKIYKNVNKIEISIKEKKINCLRMYEYDYTKKINEKFLKDN